MNGALGEDPDAALSVDGEVCAACGLPVRAAEDHVVLGNHRFHPGCVDPPSSGGRRRPGGWVAMGSRGQMAMGDTQREPM